MVSAVKVSNYADIVTPKKQTNTSNTEKIKLKWKI